MRMLNWMCAILLIGVGLYAAWLGVRVFFFDQFITPTESMLPTLMPGDRIIVNKSIVGARIYSDFSFNKNGGELKSWRTRGFRSIKPNDIVVFNFPHHDGKINFVINNVYAKRCVAIPGDSIRIVDGFFRNNNHHGIIGVEEQQRAFRNMPDSIFPEFVLRSMPFDDNIPWTIKNFGPLYVPRKGDLIHISSDDASVYRMILEWETGKEIAIDRENGCVFADGEELTCHRFSHNYYFMCGDNVSNSNDARYWGFVPEEYIVGVVTRITYSKDPTTGEYRRDRFMKSVAE